MPHDRQRGQRRRGRDGERKQAGKEGKGEKEMQTTGMERVRVIHTWEKDEANVPQSRKQSVVWCRVCSRVPRLHSLSLLFGHRLTTSRLLLLLFFTWLPLRLLIVCPFLPFPASEQTFCSQSSANSAMHTHTRSLIEPSCSLTPALSTSCPLSTVTADIELGVPESRQSGR